MLQPLFPSGENQRNAARLNQRISWMLCSLHIDEGTRCRYIEGINHVICRHVDDIVQSLLGVYDNALYCYKIYITFLVVVDNYLPCCVTISCSRIASCSRIIGMCQSRVKKSQTCTFSYSCSTTHLRLRLAPALDCIQELADHLLQCK
jgi:hypothetical protein